MAAIYLIFRPRLMRGDLSDPATSDNVCRFLLVDRIGKKLGDLIDLIGDEEVSA